MDKYHILLDEKGFIIQDETYHKKLQPPFPPRFSLGESNYKDLSFFSFYLVNDWQGGEGEEKALTLSPNAFKEAIGLNTLEPGKIKLSPKVELHADLSGNQQELKIIEFGDRIILYGPEGLGSSPPLPFTSSVIEKAEERYIITPAKEELCFNLTDQLLSSTSGTTEEEDEEETGYSIWRYEGSQRVRLATGGSRPNKTLTPWGKMATEINLSTKYQNYWPNHFPATNMTKVLSQMKHTHWNNEYIDEWENGLLKFNDASGEIVSYTKLTLISHLNLHTYFDINNYKYVYCKVYFKRKWRIEGLIRGAHSTIPATHAALTKIYRYEPPVYGTRKREAEFVPRAFSSCVQSNRLILGCEGIIRSLLLENGQLNQKEYKQTIITNDDNDLTRTVDAVCPINVVNNEITVIAAIDGNLLYRVELNSSGTGNFTLIGNGPVAGIKKIVKIIIHEQMIWFAGYGDNYHSVIGTTDGTSVIETTQIPHKIQVSDLISFEGILCFSGKTSEGKGVLYGYPDILMLEVSEPGQDCGIKELNASRYLFIPQSYGPKIQALTPGKEGKPGGIACYVSLPKTFGQAGMITDLEWFQDVIYFVTRDNRIWKSKSDRYAKEGYLITSKFFGEAELQDKIWFSVIMELEENLPGSTYVELYAKRTEEDAWVNMGEFEAGEISHEFYFPLDYNSKAVQLKIVMKSENERLSPIITCLTIRHVLTSLNKFAWTFAIRATGNLKLFDQTNDKRSGQDILDQLNDLVDEQNVISFRDVDDVVRSVIITDMDISKPLIKDGKLEAIVSLELLEA